MIFVKDKDLLESDPLFGVLEDSQLGINPATGRPRIAAEVLDGMKQYIYLLLQVLRKLGKTVFRPKETLTLSH